VGKSEPGGCAAFGPLLEAYYHHALESHVAQTVVEHTAGCVACGAALERFAATDRLIADAPMPAPGSELRQRLAARIATARAHRFAGTIASTPRMSIKRETVVRESRHHQPMRLHDGGTNLTLEDKQLDTPMRPAQSMQPIKPPTRWRIATAAMATVALIAVFALLLHGFVAGRGVSGPAAQKVSGQWHTVDTMDYTTTLSAIVPSPVFSPVNPSIVYETTVETTLSPAATTVSPSSLRRSDDGGATWHALQWPGSTGADVLQVFPSPLDAHTAFLTVTNFCPSGAVAKTHGGILASLTSGNSFACSVTYRTTDEGQSWTKLSFPVNGVISVQETLAYRTAEMPLQAQGTRLYAMLTCGPQCADPSQSLVAGRLAASTDGGATWSLVDDGVSQGICDFAAQPDGQALFVVTTGDSQQCDTDSLPSRKGLYRSDDGGQSWQSAGMLPESLMSQGMTVVSVGGKTMLYVHAPKLHAGSKGSTFAAGNDFLVSSDGGKTWMTAPLQGLFDVAQPLDSPLLVRSDGSLVVAFSPPGSGQQATIYSWKPGASSWKLFAPAPAGGLWKLLRTVSASGAETFWAVTAIDHWSANAHAKGLGSADVLQFAVAKYQP
jgi:hypothetical protein